MIKYVQASQPQYSVGDYVRYESISNEKFWAKVLRTRTSWIGHKEQDGTMVRIIVNRYMIVLEDARIEPRIPETFLKPVKLSDLPKSTKRTLDDLAVNFTKR